MMRRLRGVFTAFGREVRLCATDLDLLVIVVVAPLLYVFLYGAIYLHKSEADADVVVVDLDDSATSRTLTRWLDAHQKLRVREERDPGLARAQLFALQTNGVVLIPSRFGADLRAGRGADLELYLNNTRFLVSNDVNRAVGEVTGLLEAGVRLRALEARGLTAKQAMPLVEPVRSDVRSAFNVTESYGDFLLPGVFALILQQALLLGMAQSGARERERRALGELRCAGGGSIAAAITGKTAWYVALFSAWAVFFFAVPAATFRLPPQGSPVALLVVCALHFLAMAGFALLLASFFKSKLLVLQVLVFTTYPVFMMSGFSWPLAAMPDSLRFAVKLLPSTPFLTAFQRLWQAGTPLRELTPELLQLAVTAAVLLVAAGLRFRRLASAPEDGQPARVSPTC